MTRQMLTGNTAAAWGARLAEVDYVPAFPITPQTEIIETLAQWFADGTMQGRFVSMDSEHSMLTAAGAAAATGVRVFTATSSQGLLYGFELLYTLAGWRVPLVLVNVSRALASPITLEPDHNDVLAARDSGFLQIHAETCQEILDSILMAYRLAEDPRVLLPVIINLDGFYLSFTREPVSIPSPEQVRGFLPPYAPSHARFSASQPMAQGVGVLGGTLYSFFKYQMHLAAQNGLAVHEEVAKHFGETFGRHYGVVEEYRLDDAAYVLVMSNAFATKGKAAINRFRARGIRAGLLRLRVLRPFPRDAIVAALAGRKAVAVIDQNLSIGSGGITHAEVGSALYGARQAPPLLSYVGGLGGKDIGPAEFDHILTDLEESAVTGQAKPPRLLYTDREDAQMAGFLRLAGKGEEE
ncbi:MAG TPA: pyruvate synthase [Candidatus Tectomicrobia bacterium]|nr:pyruvate synthase [Candidatus Tectomicrobia bacterium]